jgi:hypothetical protein
VRLQTAAVRRPLVWASDPRKRNAIDVHVVRGCQCDHPVPLAAEPIPTAERAARPECRVDGRNSETYGPLTKRGALGGEGLDAAGQDRPNGAESQSTARGGAADRAP